MDLPPPFFTPAFARSYGGHSKDFGRASALVLRSIGEEGDTFAHVLHSAKHVQILGNVHVLLPYHYLKQEGK